MYFSFTSFCAHHISSTVIHSSMQRNCRIRNGKIFRHVILMIQVLKPDKNGRHRRREVVLCLVNKVVAVLTLPDGHGVLQCTNYEDSGTSNYRYHIYMGGGDGCCVRSSFQDRLCEPEQTHVRNPNYDYSTIHGWW